MTEALVPSKGRSVRQPLITGEPGATGDIVVVMKPIIRSLAGGILAQPSFSSIISIWLAGGRIHNHRVYIFRVNLLM
jgi:hypothetical protein